MFKASPACGIVATLLLVAAASSPIAAQAQVYKCPQANGTVGFQGTPCANTAKPAARPSAADLNAQRAQQPAAATPYEDPYATNVNSRPHPVAPTTQAPMAPEPRTPQPATPQSTIVADVKARNERDARQQAAQAAHDQNDHAARQQRCNDAVHNVDVLRQQRPVYTLDNKADRHYVDDKDRARTLADAEQQMAAACN